MKKCPFCAEEIQDEAVVCRACGRAVPAANGQKPNEPKARRGYAAGWIACFLVGLMVAVLALVWLATSSNAPAFRSILSTDPRLTFRQRLANLTRVSTPTPEPPCVGWFRITPDMQGQEVCVYGVVLDYEENWDTQRTYIYFASKDKFFLASNYRWSAAVEDTCITAAGIVELDIYETPYIEVADIDHCQ